MRQQLRRSAQLAMPVRTDVHAWGRVVPGPEGAPPVPVRIYRQYGSGLGLGGDGQPLPAVVYFHGGGWVTGDLDTHDASCRMLAAVARCLVVSVHYRLAPEDPFPAAVDDALAAYAWVQRHADELGSIPDGSASWGTAPVATWPPWWPSRPGPAASPAPIDVLPPAAQGLVYPAVDARLDTESLRALGEGFFLTRAAMEQFRELYLPDPSDWTVGPGVPPAGRRPSGRGPGAGGHRGLRPSAG